MRNQLMAEYLRDPKVSLFEEMLKEGTSTAPVQSWTQGLARMVQGGLGGYMAKKLRDEYEGKSETATNERTNALNLAMGKPKETQTYGDTTINWNAQQPNFQAASYALQSPYNEDLQNTLFSTKIGQDQTAQNQEFLRQQQAQRFAQEQQLANMTAGRQEAAQKAMLDRQMQIEQWKQQNDPQRQAQRMLMERMGVQPAPQAAIPNMTPIPTQPIQQGQAPTLGQVGIQPQQAPQMVGQQIDPLATYAMTGKFPEGFGIDAQGNPVMPPVQNKMTDEQAKALGYGQRMTAANQIIGQPNVTKAAMDLGEKITSMVPFVGNEAVSSDYQQFDQSSRDFINAVLRRESGAVISPSEFENAKLQYFPQYGDKPQVLAQKEANRQAALKAILQAGGAQGQSMIGQQSPKTGKVRVVSPQGKVGMIDQSELEQAISNGWRQQ